PVTVEDELLVVADANRLHQLRPRARRLVLDVAVVGDLAAALGVERRLEELGAEAALALRLERRDRSEHIGLLVPDELGPRRAREPCAGVYRAGRPRALPLLGHQPGELRLVDGKSTVVCQLPRELEREAVRVVQPEGVLAGDRVADGGLLEQPQPALERLREA